LKGCGAPFWTFFSAVLVSSFVFGLSVDAVLEKDSLLDGFEADDWLFDDSDEAFDEGLRSFERDGIVSLARCFLDGV
jgi:hypothetical protein